MADRPAADGVTPDAVLDLSIAAATGSIAEARRVVRDFVTGHGAGDDLAADLQLAVSELLTNVVEHADADVVCVRVEADRDGWTLDVSGARRLLDVGSGEFPTDPGQLRGRGLAIVAAVADDVALERSGDVIRCRFHEASGSA